MRTQQTLATAITHTDSPRRLLPPWELRAIARVGRWLVSRPISSVCYVSLAVIMGVAWQVLTANRSLMFILFTVDQYTILYFQFFAS